MADRRVRPLTNLAESDVRSRDDMKELPGPGERSIQAGEGPVGEAPAKVAGLASSESGKRQDLSPPALILDVPFLLAAFLLRVALVLPALGVAFLVCGSAVDLARARILFGSLVCVPALLPLLRLVGCLGRTRQRQESGCGEQCPHLPPVSVS